MEDLFLDVYSTKLLFPNSVKDSPETLKFGLMMIELLFEDSTVPSDMIESRSNGRGICPSKKSNIPVEFT